MTRVARGLGLVVVCGLCACASPRCACRGEVGASGTGEAAADARPPIPLVTTFREAHAAAGKRVRVRGILAREKLGDSVSGSGLTVVCLDTRLPEDLLGREVLVEGLLEETSDFEAVRGPRGEVSQGTEPGTTLFLLRGCEPR